MSTADDACRDALARVGWKVVPAVLRNQAGQWAELDERQRAVLVAGIDLIADALWPPARDTELANTGGR